MSEIRYACVSDKGLCRDNNEDNFWCDGQFLPEQNEGTGHVITGELSWKDNPAFGLFDGMGGESCGEAAAGIAAKTFGEYYENNQSLFRRKPKEYLMNLCTRLNREVCSYQFENRIRSMGSTANMVLLSRGMIHQSNLGDSKTYHIEGKNLRQVSTDHVYQGFSFGKAPLTQYLGLDEEELTLEPSYASIPCRRGDRILICSDGLSDLVQESEINTLIRKFPEPVEAVEGLLKMALDRGGKDNVTILLIEVKEGESRGLLQGVLERLGGVRK